jgi:hypothetical protein
LKDYKTYIPINNIELIEDDSLEIVQNGAIYDHEISVHNNKIFLHYAHTIFTIEKGHLIFYRRLKIDENQFIEQLSTSVYAALLFQRKIIPFHASSFNYKQKGIMLCANSEVGKSSIAYAFVKDGAQLLCDDISPIVVSSQEHLIQTNSKSLKLWEDSLNYFNIPKTAVLRHTLKTNKFNIALSKNEAHFNEVSLKLIFILSINREEKFDCEPLFDSYKMQTLIEQLFRIRFLKAVIPQTKEIFNKIGDIAKGTKIFNVYRPLNASIEESKKYLEHIIHETLF